jgi:hypothetical protein
MKTATSMWADMLGLGPLLSQINDPEFQAQLRQFVGSQFETLVRVRRCEALLEALADKMGVEHAGIGRSAAVSADNRVADPGGIAAASGAPDNGAGPDAAGAKPPQRYLHKAVN